MQTERLSLRTYSQELRTFSKAVRSHREKCSARSVAWLVLCLSLLVQFYCLVLIGNHPNDSLQHESHRTSWEQSWIISPTCFDHFCRRIWAWLLTAHYGLSVAGFFFYVKLGMRILLLFFYDCTVSQQISEVYAYPLCQRVLSPDHVICIIHIKIMKKSRIIRSSDARCH